MEGGWVFLPIKNQNRTYTKVLEYFFREEEQKEIKREESTAAFSVCYRTHWLYLIRFLEDPFMFFIWYAVVALKSVFTHLNKITTLVSKS